MTKAALFFIAAVFSSATFASESCEQIQQRVSKQMLGHGLKTPNIVIVKKADAAASNGKVVGHCEKGTMVVLHIK